MNAAFGRPARWLYHHALLHIGHGFTSAFGGWWVVVVGLLAVGFGMAVGVQIVRHRARISARPPSSASAEFVSDDPDVLEHRAADAEQAGDHQTALRLRFRAGLVRLQHRGVIAHPEAQTDRQLTAALHSPTFDALAGRHEKIVYARDDATSADAVAARTGWPRVLVEAGPDDPVDAGAGRR